jgi:glycosyltransferase involved in cell wall biosynthesis
MDDIKVIKEWEQEYMCSSLDKSSPLISIFIPAYNAGLYIENAIKTCLIQTYKNFEIIIVNDGSNDKTSLIVEKLKKTDDRINLFHNETNLGLSPTRNRGLELCKGDYIALLDADDLMHPKRLEMQLEYLQNNPELSAVSSWMEQFDESGNRKRIRYSKDLKKIISASMFYSPVSHAASMFQASVLIKLGYRNELIFAEDYDMWLRFLENHKVGVISEILYYYRSHSNQSIKPGNEYNKELSHLNIIEKVHSCFQMESTDELRRFHLRYLFKGQEIDSFELFKQWDAYLQNLLNAKNSYLDTDSFSKFIFMNYWQNNFIQCFTKFNLRQCISLLQSPFCLYSNTQMLKFLIKKLLR